MNQTVDYRLVFEIQLKLGYNTEHKAELALSRVLYMLKNTLSPSQRELMIRKLPMNLLIELVSCQKTDQSTDISRLDEFVKHLLCYELNQPHRIFYSEMDVLRASVTILGALDRKYHISDFLPYPLSEDMKNATLDFIY
ncbi:MAG: hypothetical protein RIC35_13555 [Marinoscillum sp.]